MIEPIETAGVKLIAILIATVLSGCASLDEPGLEIPHGTPIAHDQIPDALRAKIDLPIDASVERYGDDSNTASYRIQYQNGTVTIIGFDGTVHGGMM